MDSSGSTEPDGAAVVRALFTAHNEGRIDDVLRLVDTGAIWEPATRPARDFYLGRDGTLGLLADLRAAYGEHRVECHEVHQLDDGQLRVVGELIRTAPDADPRVVAFATVVTIRDGRVARLASQPEDVRAATHEEPGTAAPGA